MTPTKVNTSDTPVESILQKTRHLMTRQSVLHTVILGPMLEIPAIKRDKNGDREKPYTIWIDYDMDWVGHKVEIIIQRRTRHGLTKVTRVKVPRGELYRFQDKDCMWEAEHLPFLRCALARDLPEALR